MVKNLKGYQRYKFIREKQDQGVDNSLIAEMLGLSSGNAISVWLSRNHKWKEDYHRDKIDKVREENDNKMEKIRAQNYQKQKNRELKIIKNKKNDKARVENDNSPAKNDNIDQKMITVPTFNNFIHWINDHPDHVHHNYFTKMNQDKSITAIRNQAIISKTIDVVREMVN